VHDGRRQSSPSPAPFGLGGSFALGGEALEQFSRRLVGLVLRHEFAAKSLGEQGWGQLADLPAGSGKSGFEAVGEGEEDFDAADDFGLFGEGRKGDSCRFQITAGNAFLACARFYEVFNLISYRLTAKSDFNVFGGDFLPVDSDPY
jgi:hypothetical protein